MNEIIEIAKKSAERNFDPKYVLSVLYGTNYYGVLSWGVSKKIAHADEEGEHNALLLKVSGHHHKGWIVITLNFLDYFDVRLVSNKGEVKDTITDIFVGDLFNVIDEKVEKIPEYRD